MQFRRQLWLSVLVWSMAEVVMAQTPHPVHNNTERKEAGADERAQLVSLLKTQFEKPDSPLEVTPVVISGTYAVVGWEQAGHGGRALLSKKSQSWKILVCGGEALRQVNPLIQAGVPSAEAKVLAGLVINAEAALSAQKRKTLDSFGAVVRMDQATHRP